jgi:hypothetical protein
MNTARAQQKSTETSKGNSSRSGMFISPKKNKKKQNKATDDKKADLFIVPKTETATTEAKTTANDNPKAQKAKGKKGAKTSIEEKKSKASDTTPKAGATDVAVGKKKKEGEKGTGEGKKGAKGKEAEKKEYKVIKTPSKPEDDKAFQDTLKHVKDVKEEQEVHPTSETKAAEVKAAAVLPVTDQQQTNDRAAHYGSMEATSKESSKKKFTKETFKSALKKELEALEENLPTDEASAKQFEKDKPLSKVKNNVNSNVTTEKDKIAGPLATNAKDPNPPKSSAPTTEAKTLPVDAVGKAPKPINKKSATPKPKHKTEISMEKESDSLDDYMAENKITDEQLSKSNEPKFIEGLDSKNKAQEEAKKAPQTYRKKENIVLGGAKAEAGQTSDEKMGAMHLMRSKSFTDVLGAQTTNENADKAEQQRINKEFTKIYDKTKDAVSKRLDKISTDVDAYFEEGGEVDQAKKSFEKRVEKKLGEIYGWTTLDDDILSFFAGEDVNAGAVERVFQNEKQVFINKLDKIFDRISGVIATGLNESMTLIENGRKEMDKFYSGLSTKQQELAKDSLDTFNDKYTDLEDTVASKEQELAQDLAKKYKENVDSLRATFDEIKECVSSSWLDAAFNFLKGIIETILKIKNLLFELIASIVEAITAIITDPIGFLKNLFLGIKLGFEYFFSNIKTHLITGLIEWLTGSLGGVGITIPDNLFSLKGIFNLVMQILGLTWDYFRSKAVKLLGEPVVAGMEKAVEVFTIIKEKGVEGLWEYIKEQFSDLKQVVMDAIRDMIITKVVEAGIKWIMGLLSPAGAFVKAAMLIIDVIRFFVERAAQIFELVTAFTQGIKALAAGGIETLAKSIEKALAKTLPILIGFLAALVGITGLTGKVQKIIKRIRKRIDKAINKVIKKARKAFKGLVKKGKAKVKGAINKLFGWARVKKKFKAKDGKQHTLFFKQKGKKPILYMASTPISLKEVIQNATMDKPKKDGFLARLKTINDNMAKDTAHADSAKNEAASKAHHDRIHKQYQTSINQLATDIAPYVGGGELPPTVVTHQKDGNGRTNRVVADPLSVNPGNTKGGEATGNRDHTVGFDLVSKWEKKTVGRTNIEQSRVTATHILPAGVHGPYNKAWNVPLTDQSLNNTMRHKGGKNSVEQKTLDNFRDSQLRYVVDVEYFNNNKPPDEAYTVANEDPNIVKDWVGFFIAKKFVISIKKWDGAAYSINVHNGFVPGQMVPVQGQEVKKLHVVVLEFLNDNKIDSEEHTTEDGTVYVKTTYGSVKTLASDIQRDNEKVRLSVNKLLSDGDLMKKSKKFYVKK